MASSSVVEVEPGLKGRGPLVERVELRQHPVCEIAGDVGVAGIADEDDILWMISIYLIAGLHINS